MQRLIHSPSLPNLSPQLHRLHCRHLTLLPVSPSLSLLYSILLYSMQRLIHSPSLPNLSPQLHRLHCRHLTLLPVSPSLSLSLSPSLYAVRYE